MTFDMRAAAPVAVFAFVLLLLLALGPVDGLNLVVGLIKGIFTLLGTIAKIVFTLIQAVLFILDVLLTGIVAILKLPFSALNAIT